MKSGFLTTRLQKLNSNIMKFIIQRLGMLIAALCASFSSFAYDLEVDNIAYNVTSLEDYTVCVVEVLNKDLSVITIPETISYKGRTLKVTSIERGAISNNDVVTEIILPNSLDSIPGETFLADRNLAKIKLPKSLLSIGESAFKDCSSLSSITIPEGVAGIEANTFSGCTSLETVVLPSTLEYIGGYAFFDSGIQSIVIPSSVDSLGSYAFAASQLVSIELPEKINIVPEYCFYRCSRLSDISFSASVIESYAFNACSALWQISLPLNLIKIGERAFAGCSNLEEFIIPPSVTEIDPSILWGCDNLETLRIGSGLSELPLTSSSYNIEYKGYKDSGYAYSSLGYYLGSDRFSSRRLESVKNFIIDDSEQNFNLKLFANRYGGAFNSYGIVPFGDQILDYYYVGRPLDAIKNHVDAKGGGGVLNSSSQGEGNGEIKKLEIGGYCTTVPYFYQKIDTLILGEKIEEISLNNIYKESLTKIECLSKIPPKITDGEFPNIVYVNATLYVPKGCKEIYESSDVWKNFWDIVETESGVESGISVISGDEILGTVFNVYNLNGHMVYQSCNMEDIKKLPKGIYIVTNKSGRWKIKI